MPTADPRNMNQPPDNHRYDMTWKELRGIYPSHDDSWKQGPFVEGAIDTGHPMLLQRKLLPHQFKKQTIFQQQPIRSGSRRMEAFIFNNSSSTQAQGE
ncbi:hypothetical protein V6N13_026821 [Hibiscus sabdariffa]